LRRSAHIFYFFTLRNPYHPEVYTVLNNAVLGNSSLFRNMFRLVKLPPNRVTTVTVNRMLLRVKQDQTESGA